MSWSVTVPPTSEGEFMGEVNAAKITDTSNPPALVAQWDEQLAAAKDAIHSIFRHSNPFGDGGTYSASMSGHANHVELGEVTLYTTSEYIQVTVHRQPPTEVKP